QMIAEGGGGGDWLAVDAAAAARRGLTARRLDAGAERRQAQRALDFGGHRPGTVALIVGDVLQRGAAEPAARRQQRDRLQAIGLARAVRSDQRDHIAAAPSIWLAMSSK